MSLYNLLHGENQSADLLLAILGLTRSQIPRYRDCYWNGEEIAIHTRTGGGNRDFYENLESCKDNYPEYFTDKDVPNGPWNDDLRKLQTFLRDEDDDFDCTYATFYFSVPEALKPAVAELRAADATPEQKWDSFFAKLSDSAKFDDPQIQRAIKAFEPVLKVLAEKSKD